jgi:threonyl-tRNA synthetase
MLDRLDRKIYYHICSIIAQYFTNKKWLYDKLNNLPTVKISNGIFYGEGIKQSIQEQTMSTIEKISNSIRGKMVRDIENAIIEIKKDLIELYFDEQVANKIITSFIRNCVGDSFIYLQKKYQIPLCRQSFSFYKGKFVLYVAKNLGYKE